MVSRFLHGQENEILKVIQSNLLDPNGQIRDQYYSPLAIGSITVVSSIAERDALTNIQSGDIVKVTDNGNTYIYDGISAFVELTDKHDSLNDIGDVTITSAIDNHMLYWNGSNWVNFLGPTQTQVTNYIRTMNQNVSTTSAFNCNSLTTVNQINIGSWLDLNNAINPALTTGNAGTMFYSNNSPDGFCINDSVGSNRSISTTITNSHTHSNKALLDAINQNLASSESVDFMSVGLQGMIYHKAALTDSGRVLGQFWASSEDYYHYKFIDAYGTRDLSLLLFNSEIAYGASHIHLNLTNLNSINQDLATDDSVIFGTVTTTGSINVGNVLNIQAQVSGIYVSGDIYRTSANEFHYVDATGDHTLVSYDQALNTTNNTTFNTVDITGGILNLNHATANIIDYNGTYGLGIRESGDAGIGILLDGDQTDARLKLWNNTTSLFADIRYSSSEILRMQMENETGDTNAIDFDLNTGFIKNYGITSLNGTNEYKLISDKLSFYSETDSLPIMQVKRHNSTAGHVKIVGATATSGLVISNNGFTSNPGSSLSIQGTQSSTSSTTFTLVSDERMKKNISKCNKSVLNDILELEFYDYQYKYSFRDEHKQKRGLIAQDVLKTKYKDCIHTETNPDLQDNEYVCCDTNEIFKVSNLLTINYDKIYMDNIIAVQELIKITKNQQTLIDTLNDKISELEKAIFI